MSSQVAKEALIDGHTMSEHCLQNSDESFRPHPISRYLPGRRGVPIVPNIENVLKFQAAQWVRAVASRSRHSGVPVLCFASHLPSSSSAQVLDIPLTLHSPPSPLSHLCNTTRIEMIFHGPSTQGLIHQYRQPFLHTFIHTNRCILYLILPLLRFP